MNKKNKKNKKIDVTSIVMVCIFVAIVAGGMVGAIFAASARKSNESNEQMPKPENNVQTVTPSETDTGISEDSGELTYEDIKQAIPNPVPGSTYTYFDDNGEMKTITVPLDVETTNKIVDNTDKYKFENFQDLSDKFLEVCKVGDVETLYDLYYDNLLEDTRLGMETVPTKAEFDAGLKSDMLTVTGFDEYEYGCVELPPTQSPGSYAAYIYGMANNGKELPVANADIENCVNLVVYINNMYQTNHFMVQIGGYWYFIV